MVKFEFKTKNIFFLCVNNSRTLMIPSRKSFISRKSLSGYIFLFFDLIYLNLISFFLLNKFINNLSDQKIQELIDESGIKGLTVDDLKSGAKGDSGKLGFGKKMK